MLRHYKDWVTDLEEIGKTFGEPDSVRLRMIKPFGEADRFASG